MSARTVKRVAIFLGLIAAVVYASTLDFGDDAASNSWEGDAWLGLIPWIVIFFVGAAAIRWARRQSREARLRREAQRRDDV